MRRKYVQCRDNHSGIWRGKDKHGCRIIIDEDGQLKYRCDGMWCGIAVSSADAHLTPLGSHRLLIEGRAERFRTKNGSIIRLVRLSGQEPFWDVVADADSKSPDGALEIEPEEQECPDCHGTGEVTCDHCGHTDECERCDGMGYF